MFSLVRVFMGFAVVSFVAFCPGCGGGGARPVPVSGRVTVDGQPVPNVVVHFLAVGDKHVGTGKTAADGSYSLDNGALPGVNKVYFSVVQELPPGVDETALAAGTVELPKPASPIPPKYLDPQNPQLEFTVPAGGTKEANFELSSK
jgi:hypothetical protein